MGGEWRECALGDVIELERGYELPQQDRRPGTVPLVSSSGVNEIADLFPDSFEESELGEIPKGWTARPLYDTAIFVNGAAFKSEDFCITHFIVKVFYHPSHCRSKFIGCNNEPDITVI